MFGNIGIWDWVIILGVVLLFFGGKRLPELAKGIGKSITAFKHGLKEVQSELGKDVDDNKS